MRTWMHSTALAVTVVGLGASLAACGNSSGDAAGGTAGGKFTGEAVTVMTIAPVNTAAINEPEVLDAATAAVTSINAAGGLGGHEVTLVNCNDGNDPTRRPPARARP